MDDKSKQGPQDRTRINLNEDYDVRYWTETFGCTREELAAAVQLVGSSSDRVREELGK